MDSNRRKTLRDLRALLKNDLIKEFADRLSIPQNKVRHLFDQFALLAIYELKINGVFRIPNVGKLMKVQRKLRLGPSAHTGPLIAIRTKSIVKFKPSKVILDAVVDPLILGNILDRS